MQPVPTTLLDVFAQHPAGSTALIVPERDLRVSYGALTNQVEACAGALAAAGVTRGDRVGIALPNGLPTIVSFLAASMAGTAAPLNPAYKEEEFRFYLEDTSARFIIVPPEGMDEARRAAAGSGVKILTADINDAGDVEIGGGPATSGPYERPKPEDIALILHTSGSTGRPKRVPLTHAQLSIASVNVANTYSLTRDDVSLCVMPLFHVHGLVASTLGTLATGGTVIVPAKFNPLSHWRVAETYGATWYSAVPTMHQLLVARAKGNARPAGAGKLRFIRSCSASLAPQLLSDLEECFGAPVLEAYGMTEAAHQMASNPLPPRPHKASSVGPNTGTTEIAIMDAAGNLLQAGERGEVVIRGANVIKGYENNPEANASSFTNGWFRTGDQGYLDEDGYLLLTGRLKEMINRGGEKIAPREIDEALLSHPAVDQAVAFGVPHPGWGEEVAAAVVLKEGASATEAELTAHCKERLADFKRPKQIFITQAIPRTATGKIQRSRVAEAFAGAATQ
ncbi:MAG: AMP-binding protein [Acidimicrobiia bacterium]|nr:AMP-binding protein [Acidimicrobiia bacterium]